MCFLGSLDVSSPQSSVFRMSEFAQDCGMIMFSPPVNCELNVSASQLRSIVFFFLSLIKEVPFGRGH